MIRNDPQPMRIAFRADASVEIGTGHVMRCLTLADALRERGGQCVFLCRPRDGHLLDLIAARGHRAVALPARPADTTADSDAPAHAHWLGTHWAGDAEDCRSALAGESVDWMVVDHYALDRRWEQAVRPICRRLLVVDDLADRPHDCDLLLDQNLGRRAEDYRGLLPADTQMLIGPRYALLRPEFAALRPESLARRANPELKRLLITMGGVNKDNATGAVLDALEGCDLPPDLQITVVLGPRAPWLDQVQARAATMRRPTRVLAGVSNMARLMLEADLAIGAAGSTSWERCCLGLPSLLLILADNQLPGGRAMANDGSAILLGRFDEPGWSENLAKAIIDLHKADLLAELSLRTTETSDGDGSMRVCTAMGMQHFTVRNADLGDMRRIWEWRYDNDAARYYISADVPTYSDHRRWFKRALGETSKMLLIVCRDGEPVAHVRFDIQPDDLRLGIVSIYVSPAYRGQGISGPSLRMGLDIATRQDIRHFLAQVHRNNRSSVALFEKCGFVRIDADGEFLNYRLETPTICESGTF